MPDVLGGFLPRLPYKCVHVLSLITYHFLLLRIQRPSDRSQFTEASLRVARECLDPVRHLSSLFASKIERIYLDLRA
jgi:hypothetical protein